MNSIPFNYPGGTVLHGWELLVVALIILLLFGAKKIPDLARGLGGGIKSFKEGLSEGAEEAPEKVEAAEQAKKALPS